MTIFDGLHRILQQENINFLLTNRLPRRLVTRLMGWLSGVEQPLVRLLSIKAWTFFAKVDFSDSAETRFSSLHAAFTRELRPGARAIDPSPELLVSPCDAIVGACGSLENGRAFQIKGAPYQLGDLLGGTGDAARFRNGFFVTLRLTAGMYHRFHAPHDLTVRSVSYISGDTWNVNPIALKRVEQLFCKNERAVIRASLRPQGIPILIVPVAAILVAGIRLRFLDTPSLLANGASPQAACSASFGRGAEMGWFEHGSTIILVVPDGFRLADGIRTGNRIRVGERLLRLGPSGESLWPGECRPCP